MTTSTPPSDQDLSNRGQSLAQKLRSPDGLLSLISGLCLLTSVSLFFGAGPLDHAILPIQVAYHTTYVLGFVGWSIVVVRIILAMQPWWTRIIPLLTWTFAFLYLMSFPIAALMGHPFGSSGAPWRDSLIGFLILIALAVNSVIIQVARRTQLS